MRQCMATQENNSALKTSSVDFLHILLDSPLEECLSLLASVGMHMTCIQCVLPLFTSLSWVICENTPLKCQTYVLSHNCIWSLMHLLTDVPIGRKLCLTNNYALNIISVLLKDNGYYMLCD